MNKQNKIILTGGGSAGHVIPNIALIKKLSEVSAGNKADSAVFAKVIEGIDRDSDGIVDEAEILE